MLDKPTTSLPERSTFSLDSNGDLILTMHGTLFQQSGGAQCGGSFSQINFSDHIRQLIREEVAAATRP
jgi:hypothetical protein